jgi:V-type H+-transporting ATPase 16kDa proteolipid subunit
MSASSTNNAELLTGIGAAISIFLASAGCGIASAPAGIFAVRGGSNSFKEFGPIIIAGVLSIYGTIVSVILVSKLSDTTSMMTMKDGYKHLSAGLVVGLSCLASGYGMSKFLDHSLTSNDSVVMGEMGNQVSPDSAALLPGRAYRVLKTDFSLRFFFVMVFLEAIGLYGLIIALLLVQ